MGGDHVHLLVEYPPKVAVPSLVNSLKGASSRRPRCPSRPWTTGLVAFLVSARCAVTGLAMRTVTAGSDTAPSPAAAREVHGARRKPGPIVDCQATQTRPVRPVWLRTTSACRDAVRCHGIPGVHYL